MDYQSLSHSKWECKYHVVFIPKYRKKKLYGSIRTDLGEELHRLAEQKESKILEGHMMSDHIHMLIQIPPKYSVAQVIGYIKGKSAIYVAQGYFVSMVGLDEDVIRNYIRDQEEDRRQDGQHQLSL